MTEIKTDKYGTKKWYLHEKLHRDDGPAIECSNGDKEWYINGKLHRENGPAIEYSDGYKAWWFEDKQVTKEWIERYKKLKNKHSLLDVPVRDKYRVKEIVMSWYDNPRFKCVQQRLLKDLQSFSIKYNFLKKN